MKKLHIGNKGMMTVEAAVIVPIILIIIVTQIFFSLFLIDMSVAKSEALRLADEAAAVWKTDGKLVDGDYVSQKLISRNKNFLRQRGRSSLVSKTKARLKKRILSRLNKSSLKICQASIRGDKVYTQISLQYGSPLRGSKKYAGISGWTFQCKGTAVISNEEELLRQTMAKYVEQ